LQERGFKFTGGLNPKDGSAVAIGPSDISCYVGSSAGSIISTYLAAGYTLENIFNSFLGRTGTLANEVYPKPLPRLAYKKMFKMRAELAREQVKQLYFFKNIVSSLLGGDFASIPQFKWLKTSGLFSTAGLEEYLREEVLPSNDFRDYI